MIQDRGVTTLQGHAHGCWNSENYLLTTPSIQSLERGSRKQADSSQRSVPETICNASMHSPLIIWLQENFQFRIYNLAEFRSSRDSFPTSYTYITISVWNYFWWYKEGGYRSHSWQGEEGQKGWEENEIKAQIMRFIFLSLRPAAWSCMKALKLKNHPDTGFQCWTGPVEARIQMDPT